MNVLTYRIPIGKKLDEILRPSYVSEAVGTFFFVFTISLNVLQGNPLAPLSIAGALIALVYSLGSVSGGHFNPAVTLTMHLTYPEKYPLRRTLIYITIQCVFSLLACLLCWGIMGNTFSLAPKSGRTASDVFCVEFLFTSALCLVVLSVASLKSRSNNSYYGLAIGFTVLASGFGIGSISGSVMNPAVCFGAMLAHLINTHTGMAYFVIYFSAPMLASFAASSLFEFIWATELYDEQNEERKSN